MIFIFKKAKDGEQNSFGQEQIHFGNPEIILNDFINEFELPDIFLQFKSYTLNLGKI